MKKAWFGLVSVALAVATAAQAQAPSWNKTQAKVWEYVQQSWVDDVAKNGKWPGDYTHDNAVSWGADWPFTQDKASWEKWTRMRDKGNTTVMYEISPNAIAVAGETAVVHYTAVIVTENSEGEYDRNVIAIAETLVLDDGEWSYLSSVDFPLKLDD